MATKKENAALEEEKVETSAPAKKTTKKVK